MIDLSEIAASPLDERVKGMPGGTSAFRLEDIGRQGWNLLNEDLPLPLAVLRRSALRHNSDWMRRFLAASGARIAPHGKTTMSPQLFKMQIDDGAWGITLGSIEQVQVARRYGFSRIFLANQLIGARAIAFALDELKRDPEFDFYALVDSVASVSILARAAQAAGLSRPLQLLVEGGFPGGRTGARTAASALAVARAVRNAAPHLALRGVEGYEGLIRASTPEATDAQVRDFLGFLLEIASRALEEDLFAPGPVILTAGGSSFYDLVVERFGATGLARETLVLIRSGCYLTHDSGQYVERFEELRRRSPSVESLGPGPRAALEVWAYVQSRPEPTKAILTMGRRDASFDSALPRPIKWFRPKPGARAEAVVEMPAGHVVTGLNDQHCHMTLPASSPLDVGDMVAFGISHPCTTFDKWQVLCLVDDDYNIVSAIRTFF